MYDRPSSGYPNWPERSQTDSLLAEMRQEQRAEMRHIRDELGDLRETVAQMRGEQKIGQWQSDQQFRKLFETDDRLRVKVAKLQAMVEEREDTPTDGVMVRTFEFFKQLAEALPAVKDIGIALLVLLAALGLIEAKKYEPLLSPPPGAHATPD